LAGAGELGPGGRPLKTRSAQVNQRFRQFTRLQYFDERESVMAEKECEKPVWSYSDSMGPAIYYGHTPEFNGLVPLYKGRQTGGMGSMSKPEYWAAV
jgi:hypothetical protein